MSFRSLTLRSAAPAMRDIAARIGLWALLILPGGCQTHLKQELGADAARYEAEHAVYAELCALSQFRKRPEHPPAIEGGGFGGHSVLYLNGVCRVRDAGYPVLALCEGTGVGLSVNDHYKNANWVAAEGRAFFYEGLLEPGDPLTKQAYDATVAKAKAMGLFDGVAFHEKALSGIPPGTDLADYMYQISLGTDFALSYARDRYCARVPLTRAQMGRVVDYLNEANAPYRSGARIFRWHVVKDNCNHLLHNALAAAGVWPPWPANRSLVASALSFPVPKNEFVNLMRRTNDGPIDDVEALYEDETARKTLLDYDWTATAPGALAILRRMATDNAIYDPGVELVFWHDPLIGPYERRFRRIQSEPRYSEIEANRRYFESLYSRILAERRPLSWHLARRAGKSAVENDDFANFYVRYYDHIGRQAEALRGGKR